MPVSTPPPAGPQRFLGAVFGIVFGGIGLTVIIALWTARGFGEPPLFFKLVGSVVALGFVAFGTVFFMSTIKGPPAPSGNSPTPPTTPPGTGYTCPGCGARLGDDAEVSPKGDVKCGYCRKWFNIHG